MRDTNALPLDNKLSRSRLWLGFLLSLSLLVGCSSTATKVDLSDEPDSLEQLWIGSVVAHKEQMPADHPMQMDKVFVINDEMRQEVLEQFSGMSKHGAAVAIARWLLDEYGRNMDYDVSANYPPIKAYEERRGNCLSFTMLLSTLAAELDIEIEYNSVNIPDTWSMDETLGMVFYRHVNGVLEAHGKKQIFDLAMEIYDAGYPQKFVSKTEVMAMFMNNQAVSHLEVEDYDQAEQAIKLAVSYAPKNPDLWVNLGVIKKRQGNLKLAEIAFLHAYSINRYSVVAVSNLERLYREQGLKNKAAVYAKQAERARNSNPYTHYKQALSLYEEGKYKKSERITNRAIILHNKDPRFFELKSLIAQQRGQYRKALKALEKAYLVSNGSEQRGKYASKVELVTRAAINDYEQRNRRQGGAQRTYENVEFQPTTIMQ